MLRISRHGVLSLLLSATSVVSPLLAATFTVNSTSDVGDNNAGDGVCNDGSGNCTLRAAIEEANAFVGTDNIQFSIAGGGPHTFTPATGYASITEAVTIDGTTEPDYSSAPIIELDGSSVPASTDGLNVTTDNCVIRGLVIHSFTRIGIYIVSGSGTTITGCYIGLQDDGSTAAPNGAQGVAASGTNATIGGDTAAERNVISANGTYGLNLSGAGPRL